jgi:predicted amidohydrolase YtcJ
MFCHPFGWMLYRPMGAIHPDQGPETQKIRSILKIQIMNNSNQNNTDTLTRVVIRVSLFFAVILFAAQKVSGQDGGDPPDMIVHNANITTLVDSLPAVTAFAIRGEKIVAVGSESEIMGLKGPITVVIDANGRRVIPGLNDSHLHAIRGGLQYNLELRWDGVTSLAYALQMIRQQALRTPPGQWVRVIGGWSPFQFKEKRFPTISELNQASPSKPVFVLFAYSRIWLNRAAVAELKLTPESKPAEGGRYEFVDGGAIVRGTLAVYATIAKLPPLYAGDRINSIQHFFRELNRFGITSAIDAGATGVAYPQDYREIAMLASLPKFPIRISNFLFPQKVGTELQSYKKWTLEEKPQLNHSSTRLHGYVLDGGGEILVWGASDFENFMEPRPELKQKTDSVLRAVTTVLASHQWPIRIHATYDETITRILDVFEPVFRETGYKSRWVIDHCGDHFTKEYCPY